MPGKAKVVQGNALDLRLPDESVDLIVTSPPYFALRSYRDGGEHYEGQIGSEPTAREWLEALWAVTTECWRVLKPTGSLFVNLGDKYAGSGGHNNAGLSGGPSRLQGRSQRATDFKAPPRDAPRRYNQDSHAVRPKSLIGTPWRYALGCIDGEAAPDGQQWILRAEIVWDKPNGVPESVQDRARRTHEQWFHLTKEERYYSNIDHVRTLGLGPDGKPDGRESSWDEYEAAKLQKWSGMDEISGRNAIQIPVSVNHPLGRTPSSVWSIPSEAVRIPADVQERLGLTRHFAAFPQEWPRRLINGWCPPDGVVLDPFGGTGTTAMVAKALGRTGISVDLSADYNRLAEWRIEVSGHWQRSVEKNAAEAWAEEKKAHTTA